MNITRLVLFVMLSWPLCKGLELITLAAQLDRLATAPVHTGHSVAKKHSFAAIDEQMMGEILSDLEKKYIGDNFSLVVEKTGEEFTWRIEPPDPKHAQPYRKLAEATKDQSGNFNDDFCRIIRGDWPAYMVFSDNEYIGMFSHSLTSTTQKTKILVIPKKHTHSIMTLTHHLTRSGELEKLLRRGQQAAEALGASTYTLSINRGFPAQQVPHVHLHVEMTHAPPLTQPILTSLKSFISVQGNPWVITSFGDHQGKESRDWNTGRRNTVVVGGGLVVETHKKS